MKKFKAFTLVECLIALLILGISAMLLLQGYTQLLKATNKNNTRYVSIAEQMANAEAKDSTTTKTIGTEVTSDAFVATQGHALQLQRAEYDDTNNQYTVVGNTYKNNVTVVANYSYHRGAQMSSSDEKDPAKGTDLRYIYFYR